MKDKVYVLNGVIEFQNSISDNGGVSDDQYSKKVSSWVNDFALYAFESKASCFCPYEIDNNNTNGIKISCPFMTPIWRRMHIYEIYT